MEGYGRWLALALFVAAVVGAIIEKRKNGDTDIYIALCALIFAVSVFFCLFFIVAFW